MSKSLLYKYFLFILYILLFSHYYYVYKKIYLSFSLTHAQSHNYTYKIQKKKEEKISTQNKTHFIVLFILFYNLTLVHFWVFGFISF
jgi:hypothetical protein